MTEPRPEAPKDKAIPPPPAPGTAFQATEDAEAGFETVDPEREQGLPYRRAGPLEKRVVAAIGSAIRVSRLHALDNVVAVEAIAELVKALAAFLAKHDSAAVLLGEQRIMVNGAVLRLKRAGQGWVHDLVEFLSRMGVGGLVFKGTWSEPSSKQLLECFAQVDAKTARTPEERVKVIAERAALIGEPAFVEVLTAEEARRYNEDAGDDQLSDTERASFYYARLVSLVEASHVAVRHGRSPDFHVRQLRQTFIKIVDNLRTGVFELRLLGLTAQLYPKADALAGHAANVACLAVAMGRLAGMPRGTLGDLGFAALYHDLGWAGSPFESEEGGDARGRSEPHVVTGIARALKAYGWGDAGLARVIVAHEHHRRTDRYPSSTGLRTPHPFSRIVGLADSFDRREHGVGGTPASPARVLRELGQDEKRYEPALVALLRDVLGKRPRGTLLQLAAGGVAVVIDGGARRGHVAIGRRLLQAGNVNDERRTILALPDDAIAVELEPVDAPVVDWRRAITT